jgi:protein-S-isoprenylcysteine O-methyltransferase Ste14
MARFRWGNAFIPFIAIEMLQSGSTSLCLGGLAMVLQPVNQRIRINALRAAGLATGAVFLLAHPVWGGEVHEIAELFGFGLVVACLAGRMWCILYIGSKKNRALVTTGPYSLTRNPLYLFSIIGVTGIGLIYGSIIVTLALVLMVCGRFAVTSAREARYLKELFGLQYEAYARRTPIFWPDFSRYLDDSEVAFSPKALKQTFFDGLPFLAAFPVLEMIEYLQAHRILPVLLNIF